ncbi:hypothetical protein [Maridesulfovibrio hydrothermalis]|uniref:Rod shape-determining protein MreD n=1 Tax=Maridesulfovibrio hydrothermalis AM13 = DSM 14728 TaxID=1121451 RepID=L0RAW7_9BACT|nr:hypothetical protein [Maridesulfovibrio hydrothermalis]CCO23335.1 conserved membrane protein of unknown function [Maridesulfovibrio hydrothermalis AM13 = DSM 14728]
MHSILWWAGFTFVAIWAQKILPGVDFMAPGLLLCIQLEKKSHVFWLILIWSLIQDGVGGLPFGYSIIWYSSILILYRCGAMFFDVQSMMFALLCAAGLGLLHPLLTGIMSMLADMVWVSDRYIFEGILQALIFPAEWLLLKYLYPVRFRHESV